MVLELLLLGLILRLLLGLVLAELLLLGLIGELATGQLVLKALVLGVVVELRLSLALAILLAGRLIGELACRRALAVVTLERLNSSFRSISSRSSTLRKASISRLRLSMISFPLRSWTSAITASRPIARIFATISRW